MKKTILVLMLLGVTVASAQTANIEQALQSNQQSVQNVILILKQWAYWIIGLSFMIFAATTVLGGQEGGDKTKKMGSFFMYLGFVGLAFVIISTLFGI